MSHITVLSYSLPLCSMELGKRLFLAPDCRGGLGDYSGLQPAF